MRKTGLVAVVLFAVSMIWAQTEKASKLEVRFFGSSTCGECMKIKDELLKPLAEKNPDKMDLKIYDIETAADFQLMVKLEEKFHVKASAPQELFLPDTYLCGYETIMQSGKPLIEHYLSNPDLWTSHQVSIDTAKNVEAIKTRFRNFTFVQILLAGMVDGINPCAIATMIFLISFLATQKKKRSEVLAIGLCFTATVFLTYLLMGIGAFEALTFLKEYRWVSVAVKWTAVAAALIAAAYCFRDAIVFNKTRNVKDIKNQLPKILKVQIHKIISGQLSRSGLVIGAVVAGFLVTILEAVCTGQVYLPTIVLMTRQEGLKLTGWLYLIFYNFLFVLPLLVVMVLAYFGLRWDQLAKSTQKHMPLLKVSLGVVLVGLAIFLGFSA
jgi:cytochrome c biogenesis protein CcdA